MTETEREEQQLDARYQDHLLGVAWIEAWMRVVLSTVLVLGTLAIIALGIDRQGLELEKFSLLLSPIIGLAGIAIGYYFGRSTPPRIRPIRATSKEGDTEENDGS